MSHSVLKMMAILAIYLVIGFIPVLFVIFTDRFRRPLAPVQFSLLFALAGLAGVLLFLPTLSIVAATALLAFGVAWLSGRVALSHVTYTRTLHPQRLFAGDEADLTISLRNDKLVPLAWITAIDHINYGLLGPHRDPDEVLHFSGGIEILDTLVPALVNRSAIGPYQELRRIYRIHALKRGAYRLGPATIESGDPFGMFKSETEMGGSQEILVYPQVYTPEDIGLPFQEAIGTLTTRRALVEDPTLLAGSREYRPDDPLRRIHWKATARTGELQVRVNDPSTTAQIIIVLNLNTFQHVWQGVDLDRMEAVISVAASTAIWALDAGYAVGLRSNGVITGAETAENAPRVPPSAHPRQSLMLLEHLARLSFSGRFSAHEILVEEVKRLGAGKTLVFVTATLSPDIIEVLTARRLAGRVAVLYSGRQAAPLIRGLPVHLAAPGMRVDRAVS